MSGMLIPDTQQKAENMLAPFLNINQSGLSTSAVLDSP